MITIHFMHSELEILGKVLIAIVLCGAIGYERELINKPAGFRTQMIVGGAAALLVSLADIYITRYSGETLKSMITIDPLRTIEAIIVGVSFIGAGTILKTPACDGKKEPGNSVQNLTTAATILFSAGVGISVAMEKFILATGLTFIILIINVLIRKIEQKKIHT